MDQIELQTSAAVPAPWQQVRVRNAAALVSAVKSMIRSGQVRSGDPVPSERDLAPVIQLARNTVRSAMRSLESQGFICTHGTRGRVFAEAGESGRMSHTLAIVSDDWISLAKAQGHRGWATYVFVAAMGRVHERGYQALSCVAPDSDPAALQRIMEDRPGGVILPFDLGPTPREHPRLATVLRSQTPCVVFGDASADFGPCDGICTDHQAAGALLGEWFVAKGCRRILQVNRWPDRPHWLRLREEGFERALLRGGVEVLPVLRTEPFPARRLETPEEFEVVSRLWVSHLLPFVQGPGAVDAVAALVDSESFPISAALQSLGRSPGKDIWVSGYDNSWTGDPVRQFGSVPPAVTIEKHYDVIGREMVDLLLARIAGELPREPQRRLIKPTLVEVLG